MHLGRILTQIRTVTLKIVLCVDEAEDGVVVGGDRGAPAAEAGQGAAEPPTWATRALARRSSTSLELEKLLYQ